jgi:hypothetical protein
VLRDDEGCVHARETRQRGVEKRRGVLDEELEAVAVLGHGLHIGADAEVLAAGLEQDASHAGRVVTLVGDPAEFRREVEVDGMSALRAGSG